MLDTTIKQEGLTIIRKPLSDTLAAFSYKRPKLIILDEKLTDNQTREPLHHEVGHFVKGAFYTLLSPLQTQGRCEAKANAWMIETLCPVDRLCEALQAGCRTYWELAEELDVSEDLIKKAMDYYQRKQLL